MVVVVLTGMVVREAASCKLEPTLFGFDGYHRKQL